MEGKNVMSDQLVFARLLADADAQRRAALDRHRGRVQALFDRLAVEDKKELAECLATSEWDTYVALSAAAGDWHHSASSTISR